MQNGTIVLVVSSFRYGAARTAVSHSPPATTDFTAPLAAIRSEIEAVRRRHLRRGERAAGDRAVGD